MGHIQKEAHLTHYLPGHLIIAKFFIPTKELAICNTSMVIVNKYALFELGMRWLMRTHQVALLYYNDVINLGYEELPAIRMSDA